jgi:UDP-N-acetylglucosamine--dolichyl-phosphate N-acetylglucosaminephosphotransferase
MIALMLHSYFHFFLPLDLLAFLAALLTIILVGLIGIIDDIIGWTKGIRQYQHALFPIFAALPLMVLPQTIGNTGMVLPYIGLVNFGTLYSIIVVPIAITGASNATNMLAGLNGLEAGLALINATALLIVGLITGRVEVVLIMLGLMGALIAFLRYNWNPAKLFPGDSFTLMVGASFAAVSIIGNIERVGLMLFGLYFIELVLKGRTKMQAQGFGIIQADGTLQSPPRVGSLTHVVMRMGRFTETQVVQIILGMQVVVALITLFVFWDNYALNTSSIWSSFL